MVERVRPRGMPEDAELVEPVRVKPKPQPKPFAKRTVEIGWPVTWYRDADVHLGAGDRGFVCKIEGDTISILVMTMEGLRRMNSVRHIDDPKCQSPNLKRYGAWDYADTREWREIKNLLKENAVLKTRIEVLEAKVAAILGENPEEVAAAAESQYSEDDPDDGDASEPQVGEPVEGGGLIEETDEDDPSR